MKTYEERMANLSHNFKTLRICQHKSLERVCAETGIELAELERIERNEWDSIDTLFTLCKYYSLAPYLPCDLRFEIFEA